MRLFFAIELDQQTRTALEEATASLRLQTQTGHWTRPENLHVTVQFIGELPAAKLDSLRAILQRSAASVGPFHLIFKDFGAFGTAHDILWTGIEHSQPLQTLYQRLSVELAQAGLPFENRSYRPHLTIARQVQLPGGQPPAWPLPPICCTINRVSLMESTRLEGVLQYRAVMNAELTGRQPADES